MRRLLPPVAVLVALLALAPSASAGTLFVLTGRGWGHGVGMSQYGALGLASKGTGYGDILRHYYSGTRIQARPTTPVRVQLAAGRTSLLVGSAAAFKVHAGTRTATHPAGSATVTKTPNGRVKVQGIKGTFASPATFSPTTAPLRLGWSRYRGTFRVNVSNGRLRLVNRLGLELYIRGVVPNESPSSWPAAALRAQAVAARSYALYGWFHGQGGCGDAFCPDTSDQVYRGLGSEKPSTNAAVVDTARQVVLDGAGKVAQTFFSSSNGGRTAASADVWGSPRSYLQSVADPEDLNPSNPNRFWRVLKTGVQLRRNLGLARTPTNATLTRNASDRVSRITASGPGWVTPVDGGDSFRWLLNIRSNRFWLGVVRLTVSDRRIEWGQSANLSAYARNVAKAKLERRPYGGDWRDVQAVSGTASLSISPRITNWYRVGNAVASVRVRVSVEPALAFRPLAQQSRTALRGTMRPKRAGTTIAVQRRTSTGAWRTVKTTTLRADGTWRAAFDVRPGTYRAFAAPGAGLVPGTSPTLKVVSG